MIKMKTRVFLAMKNRSSSPPNQHDVIQHLLQQAKQKKTERKSKDAPRKIHSA
jgi:hypothetical protein